MARGRQNDQATRDLFVDYPLAPAPTGGSLDYAAELRAELNAAIKESPNSRHVIAAFMSELTGQEITKAQIDAWTADSKEAWRFPFEYAAAFEVATASTRLQALFTRKRGSRFLVGKEALFAELGRIQQERTELGEREKKIKHALGDKNK